jgi:trehalose 6-phosphate synthase
MSLALEETEKHLSNLVAGHVIALHMAILGEFEFSVNGKALFDTLQAWCYNCSERLSERGEMLSDPGSDRRAQLIRFCQELLGNRRLIIASNRGPVQYNVAEDGTLEALRGGGGVVTALSSLGRYVKDFTWVCCTLGKGDRRAAKAAKSRRFRLPLEEQNSYLRFVAPPEKAYHKYYNIVCNSLLWLLQHYMYDSYRSPTIDNRLYDAWQNGYVPVNRAFAEAIIAEAKKGDAPPLIMLHDYQLYLVTGHVRSQMPEVILQHFVHIPWPDARYWQLLPSMMYRSILESLCAADIVGLQTGRDARNFLEICEFALPGAEVDWQSHTINWNGRRIRVASYPISIDVANLMTLACSTQVQEYEEQLRPYLGEQTIVRVDRVDPSKNIIRGLRAFRILLQRHPQFRGKVKLIFFLVPSRSGVKLYQRYAQEVMELVAAINAKYEDEEWQPVKVFYENNYPQAIAGLRHYDVLLVNSVLDGMNLVAKEGPIVNTRDGVLILSEGAGAHEQLGASALSVAPADLEGTAQALYAALTMPLEERKRRAAALRKAIEAEDITLWLYRQFEDIKALTQKQPVKAK